MIFWYCFRKNCFRFFLWIAGLVALVGCAPEAATESAEVRVVNTDALRSGKYDIPRLIDSMEFISLAQFDDERVVGSVDKVIERGQKLFLLDRTGNRVWVYDRQANRLTIIGHQGTAPGEFVEATDLVLSTDAPELYVIGNRDWGVISYDLDGRFLGEHRLERAPLQGGYLSGHDALCIKSGLEPPFDVWCYNVKTWQEKGRLFPLPEDIPVMTMAFSGKLKNCGSRLFYNYPTSSLIYEIESPRHVRPLIQVTGKGFWPEERKLDIPAFLAEGHRRNLEHLVTYQITPSASLFYVFLKDHLEAFLWFPESDHLYSMQNIREHPLLRLVNYPPSVGCTDDGAFFFALSPEWKEFVIQQDQVAEVVPQFVSRALWDAIDEANKPVLVKIRFRDVEKTR